MTMSLMYNYVVLRLEATSMSFTDLLLFHLHLLFKLLNNLTDVLNVLRLSLYFRKEKVYVDNKFGNP